MTSADEPILEVSGLEVQAGSPRGPVTLLTEVDLAVAAGETVGLVGESGSGKSMTALAVMGVLPAACRVTAGSVRIGGREVLTMDRAGRAALQGKEVGMIFQDPMRSLHPGFTVGEQIAESARQHLGLSRKDAFARAVDMLAEVGISRPVERARSYPHTFSGGMAQRAMIAMALVCGPRLLLADEPTTALDVTVQKQVLDLLQELQERLGLGIVFITHDLGVVAQVCDRVSVMYAGQVVEETNVVDLFGSPGHPYTEGLLHAIPRIDQRQDDFGFIPGTVPAPTDWPVGCRFFPRCPHAVPGRCDREPVGAHPIATGTSRCVRVDELELQAGTRVGVA